MEIMWKKIDGYDGVYLISNTGCVKSVSRKIYNYTSKEKILKPSKSRNDVVVALCKNGKTKMFAVGRLVATYFIPNPNKYPMVRHIDGDITNNNVKNLEWIDNGFNKPEKYVNKKFGHLTLISADKHRNKLGTVVYECACDCGNTTYKTLSGLISGHDTSCGKCNLIYLDKIKNKNNIKDITGQRFGLLTAIRAVGNDRYGRKQWLFKCDCGNDIVCSENNVMTGNTKSCGCLRMKTIFNGRSTSLWATMNKIVFDGECMQCGQKNGLNSHHILPKNKYPQYINNTANGIVLCAKCHIDFHRKYGNDCNEKDLVEFLGLPKIVGDIIRLIIEHRDKNGKEDLLKARHFIDMLIELEYGGGNETK